MYMNGTKGSSCLMASLKRYVIRMMDMCFIEQKMLMLSDQLWIMYELKEEVHLKPKLNMFCAQTQTHQHFWGGEWCILKQIVWETQKW